MAVTIRLKRGNSAGWEYHNPILDPGEPGFELDTGKLKIGDGSTFWNDLPYINPEKKSYVINAATHFDFPSVGQTDTIYKAEKEKKIYQWNSTELFYEEISESLGGPLDIEIINGGTANG